MGSRPDKTFLRMGAHASASSWLTDPSSYVYVEHNGPIPFPNSFEEVPRELERGDGKRYISLNGYENRTLENLSIPLHGLSTPAADGLSTSGQLTAIETNLLTMLMGATPSDYTGEGAHASDSGDENTVTADAALTDIAAGAMVAVTGADSGLVHARFVSSVASPDIEVTPDLVDREDTNESEVELSSDVYAMRVWAMAEGTGNRIHVGADVEDENGARRKINGIAGNMALNLPAGGIATLNGSLQGTEVSKPSTGSPSFSAATQGSHIRTIDMPLYVGGALYMAHSLGLDFGCNFVPRMSDGGVNGHLGFVLEGQAPVLTGTLHAGSLTAPNEVTDSQLQTWQGTQTAEKSGVEVFLQVGRTAGAIMAIYIPAADVRITKVREGGQWKANLEARPTRHASLASMYVGIG